MCRIFIKKILIMLIILVFAKLNAEVKVLTFSGSTREQSVNKKLAREAANIACELKAKSLFIDLKNLPLPFYDADLEARQGMPDNVKKFRNLMIQSDLIIIASPDYNGSVPAVLKNALDWASRSESGGASRDAFKDKHFLIMSASPGKSGGAKGLAHLRAIIENIGGKVIPDQISVPDAYNAFDPNGHLKSDILRNELKTAIQKALSSP